MSVIGYATVCQEPGPNTRCFWGGLELIAGRELAVIERSAQGNCLCLLPEHGLVDISHEDIEHYRSRIDDMPDPLDRLAAFFAKPAGAGG